MGWSTWPFPTVSSLSDDSAAYLRDFHTFVTDAAVPHLKRLTKLSQLDLRQLGDQCRRERPEAGVTVRDDQCWEIFVAP